MTSTMRQALALHDAGQTAPAERVAGGRDNLVMWLAMRVAGRGEPELKPVLAAPQKMGRPASVKGVAAKTAETTRIVFRSPPSADADYVAGMGRIFRAAAAAVVLQFRTTERAILAADHNSRASDTSHEALTCWLHIVVDMMPTARMRDIAESLAVDVARIDELKALDKLRHDTSAAYRNHRRRSAKLAATLFERASFAARETAVDKSVDSGDKTAIR